MARKIILALLLSLAILCGATPTAVAEPEPPPAPSAPADDGGGVCQTVGNAVENFFGFPGIGEVLGGGVTAVCENPGNPVGAVGDAVTGVAGEVWDSSFGKIVQSLMSGLGQMIMLSMSWWIMLPSPDLQNMTALQAISEYTFQIQLILLTVSIIFVAFRLANARRHALLDESEEAYRGLVRTVLSSTLAAVLIATLTKVGDGFATWVVMETSGQNPMKLVATMLSLTSYNTAAPGLMLVIAVIGILGALMQAVLLVVRQAMLIVVVAALPIAASAGGMEVGKQSYQKLIAWIIAFLLFKPVAALAYAVAFLSATSGDATPGGADGNPTGPAFQQALLGMVLLICTALILPALMRLISPAVSAAGSGGSGAAATGGALMAGAALATGGKALAAGKAAGAGGASGAFSGGGPTAAIASAGGGGGGGAPRPSSAPRPQNPPPPSAGGSRRPGGAGTGAEAGPRKGRGSAAARTAGSGLVNADRASRENDERNQGGTDMGRHTIRQ
ncbi:hypothetical protein OG921_04850 [Aldersonia sp. NBC_00410]|nr:hypothetical protein [Aldersonia sp. NBC_00410]